MARTQSAVLHRRFGIAGLLAPLFAVAGLLVLVLTAPLRQFSGRPRHVRHLRGHYAPGLAAARAGVPYQRRAAPRSLLRRPGTARTNWLLILAGVLTLMLRRMLRPQILASAVLLPSFAGFMLISVLPSAHVHYPGERRVHALIDRIPYPGKPVHPEFVAAPDGAQSVSAMLAISNISGLPVLDIPAASGSALAISAPHGSAAFAAGTAPAAQPVPPAYRLNGIKHQWQTWNNCGPATITMALSYFGRKETQTDAMGSLKGNPNDKNVSPQELVGYAKSQGMEAEWRVGGNLDRLKQLLANDIPVVVEVWFEAEPNDWMGHYRLVAGYDDSAKNLIVYDSVRGGNLQQTYSSFETQWQVFNRLYLPVYPPEKAAVVARILGPDRDDRQMYTRALTVAQAEASAQPDNAFAWFNAGSSLAALGRHAEAVAAFDQARTLKLPFRMLWYQFSPFEAYLATGRANDVLTLTAGNLQRANDLEESHYFRGRALQAQGNIAAARAAYQAALKVNPRHTPSSHALSTMG